MRYGKFQMSPSIQEWTEAVVQRCSIKKLFIEISQNSKESTCARVSFLIKLQAEAYNFIKKETLAQLFSCEFCKISKNTFFYRTPLEAASAKSWYSEHCLYRFFEYITLSFKLFGAQQRYYEKAVITCQYPNVI